MKPNLSLLAISVLSVLLACSKEESDLLSLATPPTEGVIPTTSVLTFGFTRGIVPADSLNQWTATPYVEFNPPIPGKFVWQDTSTLVFSPDAPLAGDARFTAKLNTALLASMSGAKGFGGKDEFTFSTESFTLRKAEFFYDRIGDKRQVGIKANLEFSYAVDPQHLANAIRVTIDNQPMKISKVNTPDKNRVIALEIGTITQLEKQREISIDFDKGLISPETNTHIKMERPFVYTLPGLEELKVYGHEVSFDGTTSSLRVKVSQEVDVETIKPFITIEPARDFTVTSDPMGFTIKGRFEPGSSFRFVIKKGLESYLGGKTTNDYEADIVFGNIAPSFRFASETGTYMLLSGGKSLDVTTVNLNKVMVRVSQVFQNNIVFFLYHGRYYDWDYYWDYEEGGMPRRPRKFRYFIGNYGRQLSYDSLTVQNITNQEVKTPINLRPYLKTGYKGFYVVEIANPAEAWRSTSKLVSVSDIGLIVKKNAHEVLVFATSLGTNEPVANVTVTLISTNNQVMGTQKTDRGGVARFSTSKETSDDFILKLVTAELEDDFNFINLEDYEVETSRFDVAGKFDANSTYDAMIYGDRNIYRPGEKVYVSAIVRNLTREIPAQMPVRLNVINPQGKTVSETRHTLNEEGSFETTYQTGMTSATGDYRFELYTGNGLYLATYRVSVEDFVPDRVRINLTASAESAKPGDKVKYSLQAFNFFGPPAAGRPWEFEGSFSIIPYQSKNFPNFRFFDDAATNYSGNPEIFTGKTDGDGKASVEFSLPQNLTSTGLLRARGRVAVFDESGRPVYQISQVTVYPKDYYIGVLNQSPYYVAPHSTQKVQIVAVDRNDKPIGGFKAKIDLVRHEWHAVLRQHGGTGTLRYVSERREIPVKSETITLREGPTEYAYSVPRSGDYALRISKEGQPGYNQVTFYAYGWGSTDVTSFPINPEARVEIVADKKHYAPGESAKILFTTPFSGKMLVTVERNRVLQHRYLDVVDNAASMDLAVDDSFLPNVYISAVLFRKIKEQDIPLMAGHGFAPLMVERKSNKLDVTITAPPKIRPKTKQKVTVKTIAEQNVFVTLAAVDEGICQVKNYKTPDPYSHFYARKALETSTYDFFKDLIPEPDRSVKKSVGGGEDTEAAKRVNPLGVQRFKPVALWSGILKTNGKGEAEVTLDVPEFSGELRLMALAYKGDRFGSAEQPMKVTDPVVITPALPRFLSPNDTITMQITAFNTTDKPVSLTFEVGTSGGIVSLKKTVALDLAANQEKAVPVQLRSTSEIGKATVTVKTVAFGETLESKTELPVRPISPFVADAVSGFVDGGQSVSHEIADVYLPFGRRSYISLSPYPVVNFARQLKHLVGYPHGCLEQTVSRAFPQIYLRDIALLLDPTILNSGSPTYFVNEAITKLGAMQNHDGSFAYWPGGGYSSAWSNVYATHFLFEAKKAGYAVPEQMLSSALNAVGQVARGKKTQDYYYYERNKTVIKRIADKSTVYALYVLALAGRPEKPVMSFYRSERALLTHDTQFLLAGAFALSGDRLTYNELLPPEFVTEEAQRTSGENFDSPIRANALILNVLLETDLNNRNIPRYMEYLSKTYTRSYWYSTQDGAFTLLAFGKAARLASATHVEGSIKVGTKEHAYKGGNEKIDIEPFGKSVTLTMKGEGRVYYTLVTEGIRTDGKVRIEDKGLQVRREFLDRMGNSVGIGNLRQNDLIVVKLTLNSSVDRLENVAVSDLLPGGFEIENPRITEVTNYAFIKNQSMPQYMDIRDDRINLYTSFYGGHRQQVFYYMVRAVTAGTFQYAPVAAEAMYDGNYYSASGAGKVRVSR